MARRKERFIPRFVALVALLVLFPQPLDTLPLLGGPIDVAGKWLRHAESTLVLKLAGVELGPFMPSPDAPSEWLHVVIAVVLAALGAWAWAARTTSTDDSRLEALTRDYLRLVLLAAMLTYGLAKLLLQQFPAPDSFEQAMPFGQLSPMGLLWRFMGTSSVYERATGVIEVLAGLALLSRRTATAGALLTMVVMGNVVLLDFCFDVPVKLRATTYLLIATWLAAPEAARVVRAWFSAALPASSPRAVLVRRATFGAVALLAVAAFALEGSPAEDEPTPLRGHFAVVRQGDAARWVRAWSNGTSFYAEREDGTVVGGNGQVDAEAHSLALRTTPEAAFDTTLAWKEVPGGLTVSGVLGGQVVDVELRRVDPPKSALDARGFHPWQVGSYYR